MLCGSAPGKWPPQTATFSPPPCWVSTPRVEPRGRALACPLSGASHRKTKKCLTHDGEAGRARRRFDRGWQAAGCIRRVRLHLRAAHPPAAPVFDFKFGKFELDGPLSEKRMMTFSNVGGAFQLYHFVPVGDVNDFSFGENQLGIELMGHSENDHTRYSAALISSTNGGLGLPRGRSYDGELHLSQAFLVPRLGLQRIGAYGAVGLRPTYFLTSAGEPIAGSGRGNRSLYRVGVYGNLYVGKFDLTGVYQRAGDNVHFGNGLLSALDTLPVGARGPIWNTGTFEAHYTYSPQLFFIGRYELVRMSQQGLNSNPSDLGNVDVFTIGYRYYPFMHSRAGLAWHQEFATMRSKLTSDTGQDQRTSSYFMGFDFAF